MKFIVTSRNSVKVSAVEFALKKILKDTIKFTVDGFASKSDVSDQPMSLEETKRGAINRIFNCECKDADYFISVESGCDREFDNLYEFTLCAISDGTKNKFGFGVSTKFIIPHHIASKLINGNKSLGELVPHPTGLVGYSTNENIKRFDLVYESVITALVPFHFFVKSLPEKCPSELLTFYDSLNSIEKSSLASQIRMLNFNDQKTIDVNSSTSDISPVELPGDTPDEEHSDLMDNGTQAISDGEVAVVIMAGGQGSRLAAPVPKAMMELDIPSKSTLLELQLRRIKYLENKYCSGGSKNIPTYILTSDATHSAIAAYLIRTQSFGVKSVKLIKQRTLPAKYPNGKFVLSEKWKVLAAPNGNGAIFACLKDSGALEEMKKLGVKYVDIHPIDNALARPADPAFVGALIYDEGDAALKVVRKVGGGEKIGTLCKKNGKTVVVEYSELPEGKSDEFIVGNTGMHLFTTEIIEKAANAQLPYHVAVKNEKVVNENGEKVTETVHKFERFIFDALELCNNVVLYKVQREDEFAPVKNAPGAPVDSPDTAKKLLLDLHKKWAVKAGATIENDAEVEFRPEKTYAGDEIEDLSYELEGRVITENTVI
ncbi:UTP--glucose-1-phosphate uridylyltransferase family protein [Tritrichomonas foetus]|uniref:UDP-N-acetylglucosamine diphosphorylase n=1 Tax=Tritrichomonas foetus TaxID=1144522 RepID=A0A1J4J9Z8_9EUKA|nr:UTP--glucose-1-phosphate uridylyltransferase family protein [Tritrichomonas foetus]|eukprot:OHS96014.1 UTP--glucose-1-phosphate uridylyltransferase family protein [Tritrichomonas foetus]